PVWGGWWLLLCNHVKFIAAGALVAEAVALVLVVCVKIGLCLILLPVPQVVCQVVLLAVHAPRLGVIVPLITAVTDDILGHIGAPVAAGPLLHGKAVPFAGLVDDDLHCMPSFLPALPGLRCVDCIAPMLGRQDFFAVSQI